MNIGELKDKIQVLALANKDNAYSWSTEANIWAKVEPIRGYNIISKIGHSVKAMKFTIRKRVLTRHQAISWRDKHYMLTDIDEINRMYYEVTAGEIEPVQCSASRDVATKDELNRPILDRQALGSFPAYLVEKYYAHKQETPRAVTDITYVLVTPKAIMLEAGDLVTIASDVYYVWLVHQLDEFKNEYEIFISKDV